MDGDGGDESAEDDPDVSPANGTTPVDEGTAAWIAGAKEKLSAAQTIAFEVTKLRTELDRTVGCMTGNENPSSALSGVHKCQQRRRNSRSRKSSLQSKISQRKNALQMRKQSKRNPIFVSRSRLSSTLKRLERHNRSGQRPPRNMLLKLRMRRTQVEARPQHGDSGVRMSGTYGLDIPAISLGYKPHLPSVSCQTSGPHPPGPMRPLGKVDGDGVHSNSCTEATGTLIRHDYEAGEVLWSRPVQRPHHGDGKAPPAVGMRRPAPYP